MKEYDNELDPSSEQNEKDLGADNSAASPEFSPREPHHNPIGAIIGTVILFTLLVLGGLYIYGSRLSDTQVENSTSGELSEIEISEESEQNNDINTLDAELDALEGFENIGADLENSFDAEFSE